MTNPRVLVFALLGGAAAACADDPVGYSAPVGINLKAKSGDVTGGVVTDEKGINTESGNPYGAFVGAARETIGRDPSRIELDRVALLLGADSTGVAALGEIFGGDVDVLFQVNDSNNSYPAASATLDASADAGPIAFEVEFDGEAVPADDFTRVLGGAFKVVVRGPADAAFEGKGADADLQLTFTFAAYE